MAKATNRFKSEIYAEEKANIKDALKSFGLLLAIAILLLAAS